ncbi:MAG: hypothetical protein R2942_06950 [Ignavibacteria bacterium]
MKSVNINEQIYNYIVDRFAPDETLLTDLIAETEKLEIPLIHISRDQQSLFISQQNDRMLRTRSR